ncbi:MAG: hypothetical protein DRR19_22745 [Candidatus Parabeggiatoa sp. nov. 1]|nr:MAG: hypothetical protein DRR19_22745 [Gammaproteobacteria bacterium]
MGTALAFLQAKQVVEPIESVESVKPIEPTQPKPSLISSLIVAKALHPPSGLNKKLRDFWGFAPDWLWRFCVNRFHNVCPSVIEKGFEH